MIMYCYAPVKVNPREIAPQTAHRIMIGVRLTIQGTLTSAVLSNITLDIIDHSDINYKW